MKTLAGEQVMMRIFIGESDQYEGRPLYQALVEFFRKEGFAGATVFRGIMGFGAKSRIHTANLLRLSQDLPIVVEVVESQQNLESVLPTIEKMVAEGMVTLEKTHVIRYGPA